MTYAQLDALRTDGIFLSRMSYAVAKYALYIVAEAEDAANHLARVNWATVALSDTVAAASRLATKVVQDGQVQTDGSAITDANLQTVVETAANGVITAPVTYQTYAALASNPLFLHRVAIAVARFTAYILGESPSVPNHNARYKWALIAATVTSAVAQSISNAVVLDEGVSTNLMSSTDAEIQASVEAQISLLLL